MTREAAVLRLGHRPERDQRVTTHVGLTARALGARRFFLAGDDQGVVSSIGDVVERWGGGFEAENNVKWRRCIADWKAGGRERGPPDHVRAEPARRDRRGPHPRPGAGRGRGREGPGRGLRPRRLQRRGHEPAPLGDRGARGLPRSGTSRGARLTASFPGARIRVVPSAHGKLAEGPLEGE